MLQSILQLSELQEGRNTAFWVSVLAPLLLLIVPTAKWLLFPSSSTKKNRPPSPRRLPIIGNMHLLGKPPHRALATLAKTYGPVFLLHLGSVPTLVVSSPDAAREVMKTHDLSFATKRPSRMSAKLFYGSKDVFFTPYGEHWRQLKSTFMLQLLSKQRIHSFHSLVEEEAALVMSKIAESSSTSSVVNMTQLFVTYSSGILSRTVFGKKYEGDNGKRFTELLAKFSELLSIHSVGDFVPWLGWLDRLLGIDARADKVAKVFDDFFEACFKERESAHPETPAGANSGKPKGNFVDVLLAIHHDKNAAVLLDRDGIKALLMDAYGGGTETTASVLEWTMSELLHNPTVMKKLQNEVRTVLNGKTEIAEDDLEKMKFLKAVIKEACRLHTPATVHMRVAREDIKVMGYDIDAGTMVLINAWALANDPKSWDKPHEFKPQRFMDSSIDYKGQDFQFIPFGAGRRGCPGIPFAMANIEFLIANLMLKFDWQLPGGLKGEDLDMTESLGGVMHRQTHLQAVATPP